MDDTGKKEYKLVTEKRTEMKDIFKRMDDDEDIYLLEPYEMYHLPPHDTRKVDDVVNVTLPDPLTFARKAIAIMCGATMESVVKGRKLTPKATTKIEEFLQDIYYMVDEWLPKRRLPNFDAYINEQNCLRGRMLARSCIRIDRERGLVPDVVPLDSRFYVDDTDGNDILWAAPWYQRSRANIERQYSRDTDRKITIAKKSAEVVDYWDKDHEIVFVDGKVVRDQENTYKYPPFVFTIVPAGSMFASSDALEHQGESILWQTRDLWKEKNRAATIMQTMNVNALHPPLQYESGHGEDKPPSEKSPYKSRTIHGIEKGTKGYFPIPFSEIKRATTHFYAILEAALQRATLSAIDYGTLSFPLSAIAITQLTGSRNDIFFPRVQGKASFYQDLSRMMIDQCMGLGRMIEIGHKGSENRYTKSDLNGAYSIEYRFFTDSAEQQLANFSIANAAREYLDLDTILQEVIKVKNPGEVKAKWQSEQLERTDELIFLFRRGKAIFDIEETPRRDKEIEANIIGQRVRLIRRQREAMVVPNQIEGQGTEERQQRGRDLLPLLSDSAKGRGGRAGRQALAEPKESTEVQEGEIEE